MHPTDLVRWRAWACTRLHARRVQATQDYIRQGLTLSHAPYLAFSGGKDSTVLLHLVQAQAPTIPVVWSDDEWEYPETVAFVAAVRAGLAAGQLRIITAPITHAPGFTSWAADRPWLRQPDPSALWYNAPMGGMQAHARAQGYDAVFLGLRADESRERRLRLTQAGPVAWVQGTQMGHVSPLAWWSTDDVWAYILAHDLAYNPVYDRLSAFGVPPQYQRVGPLAQRRVLGYGQLATLQRGWPVLFNQLAALWPDARAYT